MDSRAIRILEPGDEACLEAFLLPRVASSMFLIGNMRTAGLRDGGKRYEGTYAARFQGGEITGAVAHYWNGSLIFQAAGDEVPLLQAAADASRRPIGGLIGPDAQVTAAKEALEIADLRIQMDERETLYALDLDALVVPDGLRTGEVEGRRIEPADLDVITAWSVAYGIEAIGEAESPELWQRSRAAAVRGLTEGHDWILTREDVPVAMSSFNSAIDEAVQIGGVYTPPELRGRGFGRGVVAASLLGARAEGVRKAILFTGKQNVPAQKAYTALGFRPIGDYRIVLVRPPLPARS